MPPRETSWPEWPYPEWRDKKNSSPDTWIEGRRSDNGAEGLWRVHDQLYDLTDFISKHPGGSDWLTLTKGTDITEAFEVHHLGPLAESLLPKFHIRSAKTPRNSPFTFHKNDFYRTIKYRAYQILKNKKNPATKSVYILDTLFGLTISFSIYAALSQNYLVGLIAGLCLTFTTNCSHNLLHQRNSWRMYYFNMSLMSLREARIIHALSHHLFSNTVLDLEISTWEPIFQYLPNSNKTLIMRYFSLIYAPFIYPIVLHIQAFQRLLANGNKIQDLIGLTLPALMIITGASILDTLKMWNFIILCASFFFVTIGLNVAHHHPDIFHDGDAPRVSRDWGLNQIDAVRDRVEIKGCLFFILVTYGDHTLHHLFPTVDHTYLQELYPVLEKTCNEFGFDFKMTTTFELFYGQFRQLTRSKPNNKAPK